MFNVYFSWSYQPTCVFLLGFHSLLNLEVGITAQRKLYSMVVLIA